MRKTDQLSKSETVFRTAVLTVALLLAGGSGLAFATDGFHAFTTESARRLEIRRQTVEVPAVPLENQSGERFTLADFQGKWVLVDFIYTRCPTLCSVLGGDFTQLEQQLAEPIAQGKVQILSISFDPEHDQPADLSAYLARFRGITPGWQAARPVTAAGLKRLTAAFGVTFIPDAMGGYTHNAAILLVDPTGHLVEIFDVGQTEQVKSALLRRLQ